MPRIVLHQWEISPFCSKVRAVLRHKGLPFEVKEYAGLAARKAAGLTAVGKLPVLDYDDERISDSSRIVAHLEEHHPDPPLFPDDPVQRALARVYEDWADESLYWLEVYLRFTYGEAADRAAALLSRERPSYERILMRRIVPRMYARKLKAQGLGRMSRKEVETKLRGHLDDLETLLAASPWLVGPQKTIADIAVAAQLGEIRRTSSLRPEIDDREHIAGWLDRVLA